MNLKQPFIALWESDKSIISGFNFTKYPSVTKIRNCKEVNGAFLWDQSVDGDIYSEYSWRKQKSVSNPILFYPRHFRSDLEIISGYTRVTVNVLKYDFVILMEAWGIVKLAQESIIEHGLIRDVECLINKQNTLVTLDPQ